MADVQARIAPFINKRFLITSAWWSERWGTIHKGLDISTGANDPVYSIVENGKVIQQWFNHASMGNALVIKSQTNGIATLYMHLDSFTKNLNDTVRVGEQVGIEGTTGESTGIHLHVEMADMNGLTNWNFNGLKSDYLDPTAFMGIPNVEGTWCIYDGQPTPPTPTSKKISKFPWVLYARKLRNN